MPEQPNDTKPAQKSRRFRLDDGRILNVSVERPEPKEETQENAGGDAA
jgi:hypothetical protein